MYWARFDGSDQWMNENKENFHHLSSSSRTFIQPGRNINKFATTFFDKWKDAKCR